MDERKKKARRVVLGDPKKIVIRLDPVQWERAIRIRDKFGFKSVYQISQYLWGCFLRVADPELEENRESISEEIKSMFDSCSSYVTEVRRQRGDCKPRRTASPSEIFEQEGQYSIKWTNEDAENNRSISKDLDYAGITEDFENLSRAEKHFDYIKPKRSMNNASLNDGKYNQ